MADPIFSIVIPTRDRPATLGAAIRTALFQNVPPDRFEVVVQDNAGDARTAEVVRGFKAPNLVYHRSPDRLPMSDNWEQALSRCRGRWITFIGDDDGVMPHACHHAERIAAQVPEAGVISWSPHTYWWPDTVAAHQRDRLYVRVTDYHRAESVASAPLLERFCSFEVGWGALPMIYNSWVSRAVIDRVRARAGAYFPTLAPDIFSGIANLWATERHVHLARPLCVRGTSGASIGVASLYPQLAPQIAAQFQQEYADTRPTHRGLITSDNVQILLANEILAARALLHRDPPEADPAAQIPMDRLCQSILLSSTLNPDRYDQTLADARTLAGRYGIDLSRLTTPARPGWPQPRQGPILDAEGKVETIAVNCRLAGVSDVYAAVRLCAAMTY